MEFMHKNNNQKGAALLIVVLFFVIITLIILFSVAGPAIRDFNVSSNNLKSKQSYFFAESGIEDVVYRITKNLQFDSIENLIGNYASTATSIISTSNERQVYSLSDTSGINRSLSVSVLAGTGISFNYGIQTGQGGMVFSNNSGINGNVYANGPIVGASGAYITGTAVSADGYAAVADQSHGVGTSPTENVAFGNTSATQDLSQSFILSSSNILTKVSLNLRKVGSPSSPTVTIRTNNAGKPSGTIVASGTLSASLVSTVYGWVDATFSTQPNLSPGVTYWVVVDMPTQSSSNYFQAAGVINGYANGLAKVGTTSGSGTWSTTPYITSGTDIFFEVYMGGVTGSISNVSIGSGSSGDAWANSVTGSNIAGNLYCKTGSSNNKSCNTSRDNPVPKDMSVSDSNISEWKDAAAAGGTTTGNVSISSNQSMGPQKIVGNLSVTNNKTLTLTGVIWVTGNITVSNGGLIKLSSSYGSSSGMIIADGTITLGNNGDMAGSGTSGSYIMALSTNTSGSAISLSNNGTSSILVAPYGTVSLSNNASAKEITAYKILLSNNAVVTYDSGLANTNFTTGPGGAWLLNSWNETE